MIKLLKPNTLPYPECKVYPDYEFKSNEIAGIISSQIQSWIPFKRDTNDYLIQFTSSVESSKIKDIDLNEVHKLQLLGDLYFHSEQIQDHIKLPSEESIITVYKYE